MKQIFLSGTARTALVACFAAGALAACNQNGQTTSAPTPAAALPLEMSATGPTAIAPAPPASKLPPAPPVRVGRLSDPEDTYAYVDEADAENEAFGDAPPDYAVDYDGTRPWVWYGDDRSERVAEPLPGGGYRYYYYQPGAQYPYLVRDPEYSYGYNSGVLVVVYDRYGEAMPPTAYDRRVDAASRILARGAALYLASQQQQHRAVVAANWEARQERIAADNAAWQRAQAQQRGWASYHAAHAQQEQAQWDQERFRREAEAARFAQATNHPDVAQRDWQAAQQAHAHAPGAAPGIFGLHLGGPKPPPPGAAAPLAPAGPPANGRPPGERPTEGHGAPPPAPAGPPAIPHPPGAVQTDGHGPPPRPVVPPMGPAARGPEPGGPGAHRDQRNGPQGGQGPGQAARVVTAEPARPPAHSAPPAGPAFHAAPAKPAEPVFHPAPPAPPHPAVAAPIAAIQRAMAPVPRAEAVHPAPRRFTPRPRRWSARRRRSRARFRRSRRNSPPPSASRTTSRRPRGKIEGAGPRPPS